jgi:ectoine hydroxylase-related dioxygenase (phytanoyl-CoA dioxygenase family)
MSSMSSMSGSERVMADRALMISQPFSSERDRQRMAVDTEQLHRDGYVILRNLIPRALVDACNQSFDERFTHTPFCQGHFYGGRTKRFGRLLRHSGAIKQLVQHPDILAMVELALGPWCDTIQLNLTQAIEIHPGAPAQFPHRDQDMWGAAKGETEFLVNVMWPFTDYTPDNGGTVLWPGSHRWAPDAMPGHDVSGMGVTMAPGDVLVFLGSTLHHGGQNRTNAIRRGAVISYSLGWLKSYENQFLAYPSDVASAFSPELAALIGYRQHRPNLGNVDGQCPSILLRSDVPDYMPAVDELRPDQVAMIEDFLQTRAVAA